MLDLALDLLSPRRCVGCDDDSAEPWCSSCAAALPKLLWPRTPEPQWVSTAWTWAPYDGPAGVAVRRSKYGGDERALAALGAQVSAAAAGRLPRIDLVVDVPQAWTTSLRRGLSPAAVLARGLAVALSRPHVRALRRRPGRRQAGLEDDARVDNVATCFTGHGPTAPKIEGARVLLVDDVVTTGATASACAAELLNLGAQRVHLLAACNARG